MLYKFQEKIKLLYQQEDFHQQIIHSDVEHEIIHDQLNESDVVFQPIMKKKFIRLLILSENQITVSSGRFSSTNNSFGC